MAESRSVLRRDTHTFVMHQTANFFASTQIPNLDDFVRAPCRQPLSTIGRGGDGFDAGDMGREDEYRVQSKH